MRTYGARFVGIATAILMLCSSSTSVYDDWLEPIDIGFELNYHLDQAPVQHYLSYYQRNIYHIRQMLDKASPYLDYIVDQIESRDLPVELALLPAIESAYDPFAYSKKQAGGIWQLIPSTAESLGVEQNVWYDGRRDIHAATEAALNYLEYLHELFGNDWLLTLAAYNMGQGNLRQALLRNREKDLPEDFWSLKLPEETTNYVPKFLALSTVISSTDEFDLYFQPKSPEERLIHVDFEQQLDLDTAAELAEIDAEALYAINPGFNRLTTGPNGPHQLLLPAENAYRLMERLTLLPKHTTPGWETYAVQSGDTLNYIAAQFATSSRLIAEMNHLTNADQIKPGQELLIPVSAQIPSQTVPQPSFIEHRVQTGDTLWKLAKQYAINPKVIAETNDLAYNDLLRVGRVLKIPAEGSHRKEFNRATVVRRT